MFNRFAIPATAAALTAITLLTGCAGASSTSTTPPTSLGNHVRRHGSSSCPCLYVANLFGSTISTGSVTVYAAGATGNASPIQKLNIYFPTSVAVDASGKIYVTNPGTGSTGLNGAVMVYAADATGNDPPLQTIAGSKTGLDNPVGVAVDPVNGDIYVANIGNLGPSIVPSVTIYAPGANGNVPPIGTIAGTKTGLNVPGGLALDASGNIYVPNTGQTIFYGTVTVYAAGSVGNVVPIQTITGLYHQLASPTQVALDSNSNIYVANLYGRRKLGDHVAVYAAGANGMARAIRMIVHAGSYGIALDGSNKIYVSNGSVIGAVTVYAPGRGRHPAPINTISGSNTGLDSPVSLAIH